MAASSNTAERLCYMLASTPVSGMTRPRISGSRRHFSGHHQTPAASLRHLTSACNRLCSAPTKLSLCLLDAESSLNCLVSTAWSDHLVIVSLKAHIFIVTQPHLDKTISLIWRINLNSGDFTLTKYKLHGCTNHKFICFLFKELTDSIHSN